MARNIFRLLLCAVFSLLAGGALTATVSAQNAAPTAEQADLFRSLTPEQQDAILRQVGRSAGTQGSSTQQTNALPRAPAPDANARQRPRPSDDQLLFGVLRPEDTVLIQIDFRRERRQEASGSGTQNAANSPAPQGAGTAQQRPAQGAVDTRADASSPPPPPLTDDERKHLQEIIDLVRGRNPYRLDRNGVLNLPGFAGIALGGLDDMQATQRLSLEPAFLKLDISLTRLPLTKTGAEGLKRFGYDLFRDDPAVFSPVTDVPVPADYVVGPGDQLQIQLYGAQNRTLPLVVGRDGRINFPELGPISVGGRRFSAVADDLQKRVSGQLTGTSAAISMGEVRSIRVFVLGEAERPGSYLVSGLATMTSALFASGGIRPIGSLRDIQLKRQGQVVRHLDLYDLLIDGNTSDDARLQAGDAIFIPPVGSTLSVEGEVKRPAIYELKGPSTIADVVRMAGGLTPEADSPKAALERVDAQRHRVVLDIDVSAPAAGTAPVQNGDALRVPRLRPTLDSGVQLQGYVFRPRLMQWHNGMRLSSVIESVDEVRPNGDLQYVLVRRELPPDRRIAVLSANLSAALASPGSAADIELLPRDQITVFDLQSGRERVIKPLMDELALQSRIDRPSEIVRIGGSVKVPGEYPLEPGMKVSDLIRAGGSLSASAYGATAELSRYTVVGGESRQTRLVDIDLAGALRGDPVADVALQPFDYLLIKETPDWRAQEEVVLRGEVRFPGTYRLTRGETLQNLLQRAGGLTQLAFPGGSVFLRKELREREQEQINLLASRMQTDVASLALQASQVNQGQAGQALAVGQSLLAQIGKTRAVGRLVIDLDRVTSAKPGSTDDLILRDGDELIVPKQKQEVTVIGEVQTVTSHFYRKELNRNDYIALSGGLTRKADQGKIYVVRANGSVVATGRAGLFSRHYDVAIRPGDTIVVPLDIERIPSLPFWQAVTQIIYNLAVSVAAVNSF